MLSSLRTFTKTFFNTFRKPGVYWQTNRLGPVDLAASLVCDICTGVMPNISLSVHALEQGYRLLLDRL